MTVHTGNVSQYCFEALRGRAARRPPGTELGTDHEWERSPPAGHESQLRCLVHQAVQAYPDEVHVHDLDDRAEPGHGRTYSGTDYRGLRDRGIPDAAGVGISHPAEQAEDIPLRDVDTRQEHARVSGHVALDGFTDGRHQLERLASRLGRLGNGDTRRGDVVEEGIRLWRLGLLRVLDR